MLGPFYNRDGEKIGPEEWERLTREDGYSVLAAELFTASSVLVRTRWLGHDRENNSPPCIFHTKALGDDVPEVFTATEGEAIAIHEALCARYTDQKELLDSGGARLLSEGVL